MFKSPLFNLSRYFWLVIFGTLALGLAWPAPGIFFKPYLFYFLFVLMFFSCLKINLKGIEKEIKKSWWRYLVLLFFIFFLPAMVILLFSRWIPDNIYVGLILAAACPAAVSSVFLSDILHGEPAKALITVFLTHIVSPLLTPLVVWLLARHIIAIDFLAMVFLIAKLVILPLLAAQLVRYFGWADKIYRFSSNINIILLGLIIWGTMAPARALILGDLRQFFFLLLIVIIAVCVGIYVSVWFGRSRKEDVTYSVVDTYKNFALSSVVALSFFGPAAVLGSVVYSVVDNLAIAALSWLEKD